jgi:hypothetical protein
MRSVAAGTVADPTHDTSGWIPGSNAVLLTTAYWVAVDKTARRVSIYSHWKLRHVFSAVTDKPATPT